MLVTPIGATLPDILELMERVLIASGFSIKGIIDVVQEGE